MLKCFLFFSLFTKNLDLALQSRGDHVKLHVTLMKSSFPEYQNSINGDFTTKQANLTFDARKIIEVRFIKKKHKNRKLCRSIILIIIIFFYLF